MISEEGSLVVMDIIVKLEDGSYATVEIQRIGYLFPGERTNCYLADMIMRQYNGRKITGLMRRMLARECVSENVGVAGYVEAFRYTLSG